MTRRTLPLVLLWLVIGCRTAAVPELSPAAAVDAAISRAPLDRALWGIRIEDEAGAVLYAKNDALLMTPASNRKIFTAAVNESCFDLAGTIPTELWLEGEVVDGVLSGNLVLKGWGDPSLAGRHAADRDAVLEPFVRALEERGVRRVSGGVVGDGSAFDDAFLVGSWQYEDFGSSYQAPVGALSFNENVVGLRVDRVGCGSVVTSTDPAFVRAAASFECGEEDLLLATPEEDNDLVARGALAAGSSAPVEDIFAIDDPSLYAAQALDDLLRRRGVEIAKPPAAGLAAPGAVRVATIESPPLAELLSVMMKVSQNLYADALFKRIDLGGGEPATWADALARERLFLVTEVGLHPEDFYFEDGSGLSVRDLITPRGIVKLLRWMDHPSRRGVNWMMFATPGESGTLRRRLAGFESTLRGKTGTLTGVNALSGWVVGEDGGRRYFAILVNHHFASARAAQAVLDEVAAAASRM